jgi:small-conductance mechanosensitive channel
MKKYHLLCQLAAFIPAVIMSFIAFDFSVNAQENNSSNNNANQTPTVSLTPKSSPTPIPLSEVVTQAETTSKKLQETQTNFSKNPSVAVIQDELPKLAAELDARMTETNRLLTAQPSLETLRKVEQDWKSLASVIPDWKKDLRTQAAVLDNQLGQLNDLVNKWQLTFDATNDAEIPPEISERIAATISAIKQTQKQVEERRAQLLTLQNRISEQEARINDTLETISRVREEALSHLFVKDSPAIWNVRSSVGLVNDLVQETKNSITEQMVALSEYANRKSDRFILHGIILLLLTGGLYWARRGVRPKVEEEPKLKQATVVFEYPFATALILTILLSGWFYPQVPRILNSLLGAAALIPGVIILRQLIEKSLFPILNALMVFYFVDRLREITTSLPVVSRVLFLAEMLGAIIFLVWILRSKRLSNKIEVNEERRAQLLTLQNRISEQEARINDTLETISRVREEALSHLFVKDSPAIWNVRSSVGLVNDLVQETKNSITEQMVALSEYANRKSDRFILHGIILLLLTGGLYWARRGVRPKVEEEPKLKQATVVFEYPFATALILTILLSGWFYPQVPRILNSLLGAAALIPGVIILRQLIEKSLFPILNALMVFYFVDRLREITTSLPVVSRVLFLAEMLGAIIFLVWILRSKRLSNKIEVKHQRIFTLIKKIIPFALAIFTGAFIANVLGFVSLARIVGNGVLGSAYVGLTLYAAIRIAESLLLFAVRVRPFSSLGMVKTHRRMLQDKILRVLRWLAMIIWAILTLNLLSVREPVFTFITDILTAKLTVGSISISLGDVIAFVVTVWLAFVISRFVRFILEEDVYPRVNLAGGIPYAISTIAHYVVLLIGFFMAVAALGIDLTKFTILAGAFGVGLGFGLQNIVNNFVSGLILLFERPVKVGDVIQLGEQQGDLKRIGLRASVIRTLQGSEVIVPNGQLISEQVINWTFSDEQRRLEINVGVAYGNNPTEIIKLLTKSVSEHPDVLKEPAPGCLFLGFGDNSLDFQARAWTSSTSQWVSVKSDLAVLMHDALRDANIEIPFPQRDLHLKNVDEEMLKRISRENSFIIKKEQNQLTNDGETQK